MFGQILEYAALGLVSASVLAIAAVGFTLQFGVTNYFNFGYGEYLTFGAFVALVFNVFAVHLNIWLAMCIGGVATALLALIVNRAIFAPFVKRRPEPLYILIVTFAVGVLLNNVYDLVWGSGFDELSFSGATGHDFGPLKLTANQITFFFIAIALMVATQAVLNFTRLGRSMRAVADDRTLARVRGLDIGFIVDVTWLMTGFMAGVSGVMLAMQTFAFNTSLGDNFTYLVYPAVILGGIGQPYGALIGAFIIGLTTVFGSAILPGGLSPVLIFVAVVAIVLLRPQGLLGSLSRLRVQEG